MNHLSLPGNLPPPTWQDEEFGIALYLGDCLEILPQLPKVDCVVTDPPYNMTMGGGGIGGRRKYVADIKATGLDCGFDITILSAFTDWTCFCAKASIAPLIRQAEAQCLRWQLVTWNKTNPTPLCNRNYLPDTEYIIHAFKRLPECAYADKSRWILGAVEKNDYSHPTVKPMYVMERLIRACSDRSNAILDMYAGSGTTGVACVNLGRAFIGIEIEQKYFDISVERIRKAIIAKQHGPLFAKHQPAQAKIFEAENELEKP